MRLVPARLLPAVVLLTTVAVSPAADPPKFSAEQVTQILALACEPPQDSGRPVTHWTPRELAEEAKQRGIVRSISPRQVGRFLKDGRPATAPQSLLAERPAR